MQYNRNNHSSMSIAETLYDGNGKLLAESHANQIIGEVEILYRSKRGNVVFTRKTTGENDLLVSGGIYLCEKINQIRVFKPGTSAPTTPLDISLGVHTPEEIDVSAATIPFEKVCGIMVGNGGSGDTYNTVHKVHKTDLAVPGMLPFRVRPLSSDLSDAEKKKYILRVEKGGYAYYYGKKFNVEPEINVQYEDGTVPNLADLAVVGDNTGKFIKTFIKYTASIDENEVREWFRITQGNTLRSLVNSIGLMTGYPMDSEESEFGNVRGLTTLNMENAELKDSESTVSFTYRLHFV